MADASPFALRLSSAASWVACAAYPSMNRRPEATVIEEAGDTTVREEGTAMHWAAYCLATAQWDVEQPKVGDVAPNGVVLTDELLDGALFYVDVLALYDVQWTLEQSLPAPEIHPQCGGSPDAFAGIEGEMPRVIIPDLKGGFRIVDVFPNWQLIGYASAVLSHMNMHNVDCEIEFVIVQPRAFHRDGPVRRHVTTVAALRPYWDAMRMAASIAMGDYAGALAGSQCDDCNARSFCTIAHAAGMRALEISGEPDIQNLTAAAVDYELLRLEEAQRAIEARLTGLQAKAVHMMRKGEILPHWAMERGQGRLSYNSLDAEREAIAIAELLGKDIRKPQRAITPTQAGKLLDPALLETLTHRPRGEAKLVRFNSNTAAKAFSKLGVK